MKRGYIHKGKYYKGSPKEDIDINATYDSDRRQKQREDHRRDIIQPYNPDGSVNPDFAHAFPESATKYFTPEQLREL